MKKSKKQFSFILIIFLALCAFSAAPARAGAASLFLKMPASVKAGENLDVTVSADTGGVLVNSIESVIGYDASLLSFSGYADSSSVIKLWIDPPHAEKGRVSLSGIIPGGVLGLYDAHHEGLSPIPLVHLIFVAKAAGDAKFSFLDSKILENDGEGTPLPHEALSAEVEIVTNPDIGSFGKETPANPKENTGSDSLPGSPDISSTFISIFWIVLLFAISCIVVYKLLKYKL